MPKKHSYQNRSKRNSAIQNSDFNLLKRIAVLTFPAKSQSHQNPAPSSTHIKNSAKSSEKLFEINNILKNQWSAMGGKDFIIGSITKHPVLRDWSKGVWIDSSTRKWADFLQFSENQIQKINNFMQWLGNFLSIAPDNLAIYKTQSKGENLFLVLSTEKLNDCGGYRQGQLIRSLIQQVEQPKQNITQFEGIIGDSPKIQEVIDLIKKVAPKNATVLLSGETGTGKELVAKAIHRCSERSDNPFVAINCGALAESLLESELFGHKKGAFTGADKDKLGLFETANGGTIFLDEIGDMPVNIQVKILRVIQERKIRRVGGLKERDINIRIISATNKNLDDEVKAGRFRQDLYYRIDVVKIELPPLREKKEDINLLIEHFLIKFQKDITETGT